MARWLRHVLQNYCYMMSSLLLWINGGNGMVSDMHIYNVLVVRAVSLSTCMHVVFVAQ
jgi:hypothetical protein